GAQRTELVESIFGLRKIKTGRIELNGNKIEIHTPHDAIKDGIGLITEDRRGTGIFPLLSITTNTCIASIERYLNKLHLIDHKKIQNKSVELNKMLSTKTPSMTALIKNLSGGNQQKV
ncbi:MAG TPA: sugar ABC transporter ATP-binding protein, partial [Treponema sp.]|nr:sugar ABC transporter ATP-binding protein [Treponema sp.]